MTCRIDTGWSYRGCDCIRLENEFLAVDVLPGLGGKIHRFIDKGRDADVLWHSPRIAPHSAPLHANFDDHWAGGWDEIFPTGVIATNRYGDVLPHMGELWTQPATWEITAATSTRVELVLSQQTPITPARFERRLTIERGTPALSIAYRLENTGRRPFDFNWGLHPALAIDHSTRLDVPARHGLVDESGGDILGRAGDTYDWPMLNSVDLRRTLAEDANCFALHYLTELVDGWVAATHVPTRRGFGLVFDHSLFSAVWMWLVYGGWRDYYHAILEPWTGFPSSLADAVSDGRARTLAGGDVVETEVAAVIYSGVESVSALTRDGEATA